MITLDHATIEQDDISLIGSINFDTFGGYTTTIAIGNDRYELQMAIAHKQRAWESDIRGYWQDYLFSQIDSMARNIVNDKLKSVNMNVSFTLGGVSITMELKFNKLKPEIRHDPKSELKKLKKELKKAENEQTN